MILLLYALGAGLLSLFPSLAEASDAYLQVGAVIVSFVIFLVQSATQPSASGRRVPSRTANQDKYADTEHLVLIARRHIAATSPSVAAAFTTLVSALLLGPVVTTSQEEVLWWIAVLFLLQTGWVVLIWYNTTIILTNLRIIQASRRISKQAAHGFSFEFVNGLELNRSWLGRLLGYGTLVVRSSTDPDFSLTYLPEPEECYKVFWALVFGELRRPLEVARDLHTDAWTRESRRPRPSIVASEETDDGVGTR